MAHDCRRLVVQSSPISVELPIVCSGSRFLGHDNISHNISRHFLSVLRIMTPRCVVQRLFGNNKVYLVGLVSMTAAVVTDRVGVAR